MGELDDILQELEASLGARSGEPQPLLGGITNRNYRVRLGGEDYVVRRPGRETELLGIDRASERIANEAAAELGIAPEVALALESCLVTRHVRCRALDERAVAGAAQELASALRAFHDCGVRLPSSFEVADLLARYARVARERGVAPSADYERAQQVADRVAAALGRPDRRPCHNDLLAGNVIAREADGAMLMVDWEYAGMGDARFDLGNLSVNNGFGEDDDERLLRAYAGGAAPSDRERAALKLARVLSDAREGAWGVLQGAISELEFDFASYAQEHFARLAEVSAKDEFEEWLAVAAG